MMISSMKNKKLLQALISVALLIAIWQITAQLVGKPVYYPSFTQTISALANLALTGSFWVTVTVSILRVIGSFAISMLFGMTLAVLCSLIPSVTGFMKTISGVAKATPVASFIILAMIWFHSSFVPVFVGILMIAPIVFENTLQGIENIDSHISEMSRVYKIPTGVFIRKIALPYTKPYLSAAVSLSLGIGFKAVVSAEVLCQPSIGIGAAIYDSKIYLETPQLFALTLTVILLSFCFEKMIGNFVRRKGQVPYS